MAGYEVVVLNDLYNASEVTIDRIEIITVEDLTLKR
jgi:hypothetical protein